MSVGDPSRPPLACRPSPPLGGRSDVTPAFASLRRCRISGTPKLPISLLVGEMSGRTERGAVLPAFCEKFQPLPR
ncbi:MAG: hypothetical protein EOR72_09000 [Mesorhizobium sp.]|nr:MAG: hypothetical protein EOR72_09000 [Mesorhizobium sp.]